MDSVTGVSRRWVETLIWASFYMWAGVPTSAIIFGGTWWYTAQDHCGNSSGQQPHKHQDFSGQFENVLFV
jgi:hypothetical protein